MVIYSAHINVYSLTGYDRILVDLEDVLVPFIESKAAMNVSLQPY